MRDEPNIAINGKTLTKAQAMTIRVAIESFMIDLSNNDDPVVDDTWDSIASGYKSAIREIRGYMGVV